MCKLMYSNNIGQADKNDDVSHWKQLKRLKYETGIVIDC